jgi:hypothetical protein
MSISQHMGFKAEYSHFPFGWCFFEGGRAVKLRAGHNAIWKLAVTEDRWISMEQMARLSLGDIYILLIS